MDELFEKIRTWYEGNKEQIQLQWIRYKKWYVGLGVLLIGILAYGLWGPSEGSDFEGVDEYEQGQSQGKGYGQGQSRGQGRAKADSDQQGLYSNGYKKAKFSSDGGTAKDSNNSKAAKGSKNSKGSGKGGSGDEDTNERDLSLVYSVASIERPYALEDVFGNEMVFKGLIGSGPLVKGALDKNKKDGLDSEEGDSSERGGLKGVHSGGLESGGGQGSGHRQSSGTWSSSVRDRANASSVGASRNSSAGASSGTASQATASSSPLLLGLVGQDYAVISVNGQSLLLGVGESAGDIVLESIGDSGVSIRRGGVSQWLSL